MTERLTYSVREAAHTLGCSERLVWKLIRTGKLKHVRLGRRVLITPEQLTDLLKRSTAR